jgi:hypothetical protein
VSGGFPFWQAAGDLKFDFALNFAIVIRSAVLNHGKSWQAFRNMDLF